MRPSEPAWRVVARPINELGDVVYDVYRGKRRHAWGLTDRVAADRWIARLSSSRARTPTVKALELDPVRDATGAAVDSGGTEAAGERDDSPTELEPFPPRRVWWNE